MTNQAQHTPSAGAVMENTYYKVLVGGRSCHGGDVAYSLPTQREDGTWQPGEWMPPIEGDLRLCAAGYHLTREPARWWQDGAECYAAEWDGDYVGDGDGGDKIAVRRCRLLRRLDAAELAQVRVFVAGSHEVSDGYARASGSARVRAYDSARVEASGSARVVASGSARVEAYGSAQVRAYGSARVRAYDYAQVGAYDYAQVRASGSARVWAYGTAQVEASDSAQVWAYGTAQVWAYGTARVEASDSALVHTTHPWGDPTITVDGYAVWVDRRHGAPVVHAVSAEMVPVPTTGQDGR